MGPLAGFWWRKQGRVPGVLSPELGILEARELRLQEAKAEGMDSGQCAWDRRLEAQGPSSHSRACVCFSHSCRQCPEPAPPTSGCYRNAPKLLATPTCPPRHQKGRAPGQWEGWGRLSLGNVPASPTVRLALNVVTIARWETVVGTTAPPPGLRPPHSVLTGLFSFPVPTRAR